MSHLDGNAIAGVLGDIFGAELTTALSTCDGCGKLDIVAELMVYTRCPGIVVRCPHCDSVLMRIVRIRERYVVDLSGTRDLRR